MIPYDLEQTQEIARVSFAGVTHENFEPAADPLEETQEIIPAEWVGVFDVERIHDETAFLLRD